MNEADFQQYHSKKARRDQLKGRILTLKERILLNEGKIEIIDNRIVHLLRRRRHQTVDQEKLAKISQMMEDTEKTIEAMSVLQLNEITKYPRPPEIIQKALEAILLLLKNKKYTWERIRSEITNGNFIRDVLKFNLGQASMETIETVKRDYILTEIWDLKRLQRASKAMGPLGNWLQCQIELAEFSKTNNEGKELIKSSAEIANLENDKAAIAEEIENDNIEIVKCEEEVEKLDNEIGDLEFGIKMKQLEQPAAPKRVSALNGVLIDEEKINRKLNQIVDTGHLNSLRRRRHRDLQGIPGYFTRTHTPRDRLSKGLEAADDWTNARTETATSATLGPKKSLFTSGDPVRRALDLEGCYFLRQVKEPSQSGRLSQDTRWGNKVADKVNQTDDALLSPVLESIFRQHYAQWEKEKESLLLRINAEPSDTKVEWERIAQERAELEVLTQRLQETIASSHHSLEAEKLHHKAMVDEAIAVLEAERSKMELEKKRYSELNEQLEATLLSQNSNGLDLRERQLSVDSQLSKLEREKEALRTLQADLMTEIESEKMRLQIERQKYEKLTSEMQQKLSRRSLTELKQRALGVEESAQTDKHLLYLLLEDMKANPEFPTRESFSRMIQTTPTISIDSGTMTELTHRSRDIQNVDQSGVFAKLRNDGGLRTSNGSSRDISLPNLNISAVNDTFIIQKLEENLRALDEAEMIIPSSLGPSIQESVKLAPPQYVTVKNQAVHPPMTGLTLPVKPAGSRRNVSGDESKNSSNTGDRYGKIGIVFQDYFPKRDGTVRMSNQASANRASPAPSRAPQPIFQSIPPPLYDSGRAKASLSPTFGPTRTVVSQVYSPAPPPQVVTVGQPVAPFPPGAWPPNTLPQHFPAIIPPNVSLTTSQNVSGFPSQKTVKAEVVPQIINVKMAPRYEQVRAFTPDLARNTGGYSPVSQRYAPVLPPASPNHSLNLTPKTSIKPSK